MMDGYALLVAAIGGCARSVRAIRRTRAMSTTMAMRTTTTAPIRGLWRPDSIMARPSSLLANAAARKKEGVTIGCEPVNLHPARCGGRYLHGGPLGIQGRFMPLPYAVG